MRTLSQRELLLALLDRQLLLQRSRLTIPKVLERMGGLQAQYAPSMYVGLWTRMEDFSRADLDRALERRAVVQGTLLRSTIHLVSPADYWPFATAIRQSRKQWWLKARKDADAAALDTATEELRAFLRDGPQRAKDIEAHLGVKVEAFNQWTELLRVPPSGTWDRRRADLYALADEWIPRAHISVNDATEHVVRRYLGGFGPATVADIASWAGLPPKQVLAAVERMRPTLREYGDDLLDLRGAKVPDADRDPDTQIPVRFLAVWDAALLVHGRRTGILAEEHRPHLFSSKNPHSFNTFLVDGRVAGTWKYAPKNGIDVSPFGKLSKATVAALEEEAGGLEALHQ